MVQSLLKKQEKVISRESLAPSKAPARNSSEMRAGFLVVVSLAVLTGLLLWSGQSRLFRKTKDVPVTFNFISGLAKNAPVQLAGHKVGKVKNIVFTGKEGELIAVTLSVDENVPLRTDSAAYIDTLGLMGEKYVELTPGTTAGSSLPQETAMKGTDPIPMMELIKKGTEITEQFEKTADSMDNLLVDLHGIVGKNEGELTATFQNLNATSSNLKEMTADLKAHPWKLLRKTEEKKKKKFLFF